MKFLFIDMIRIKLLDVILITIRLFYFTYHWYYVEISTDSTNKEMLEHIIDDVLASNGL